MEQTQPLVTIGIPTFNRSALLKQSIESALSQEYRNIEVVVSDNASTDDTEIVCRSYCEKDARIKYFRQESNIGPARNFSKVLLNASGEFFMWLGDDDWIDKEYVGACIKEFSSDRNLALVSGVSRYYRGGQGAFTGKVINLLSSSPWHRIVTYYAKVADNGMFYGLMRTQQIRSINIRHTMGGDWLLVANIAFMGKIKILPKISVHRELGGASASCRNIAESFGLPKSQAMFPLLSIATSAWADMVVKADTVYRSRSLLARLVVATAVFFLILIKRIFALSGAVMRRIRNSFLFVAG